MKHLSLPMILILAASLLPITGCGLLYSKKGQLKTRIQNFNAVLNASDWERSAEFLSDSLQYTPYEGDTLKRGGKRAFLKELTAMEAREFQIHLDNLRQINDKKFVVLAMIQARKGDATGSENVFWDVSMIWEYANKTWTMTELKATSAQRSQRS